MVTVLTNSSHGMQAMVMATMGLAVLHAAGEAMSQTDALAKAAAACELT